MQKINLIVIGRLKEKHYSAAAEEYLKRLRPFMKIEVKELAAESFTKSSKAQAKAKEAEKILATVEKNGGSMIVLDERGKEFTSLQFADFIDKANESINLVIGGSLGFDPVVLGKAKVKIALSQLTIPHELARVILLEQLYRAATIQNGKEYHY